MKWSNCQPSSVRGAHLAGPRAAITNRTMMTTLQTFAPARIRAFASALIARPLTMVIVTSATPLRNFLDRPGRREAAVGAFRSKRDGEHCKRGGRGDKAKACHHHDRDERVSGAKRQNNHLSATRHLPGGAQNGGDGRASSFIDIGGCTISGQRCWKLDTRGHSKTMVAARPQHMQRVFITSRMVRHG